MVYTKKFRLYFHLASGNDARKAEKTSVFVDKAVNQIITAAESAMREKLSCKVTD